MPLLNLQPREQGPLLIIHLAFSDYELVRKIFLPDLPGLFNPAFDPDIFYPAQVVDLEVVREPVGPIGQGRK